jgi:hypothetical protein
LIAVTTTRNACETSPLVATYVFSVAPLMSPQDVPSLWHRCHWYVNVVGAPLHVPFDVVSVLPSRSVPLIDGGAVFCGAALERAAAGAATTAATSAAAIKRATCFDPCLIFLDSFRLIRCGTRTPSRRFGAAVYGRLTNF